MSDLDRLLDTIHADIAARADELEADADAKDPDAAPGPLGIAVVTADGTCHAAGAARTAFPIQSIAKVFALDLALQAIGDEVFTRVGREPSGDPFNSIIDLERNKGIPRNPFINAGALVVVDILVEHAAAEGSNPVIDLLRRQSGVDTIPLDEDVLASEEEGGDLNRALMYFARHHGNLRSPVDAVMAAYIDQCAVSLDCVGLARAGLFLSDTVRNPGDAAADKAAKRMRRICSLMTMCGHYDGSGDFAYRVGLPSKSGVGGGILAIVPETAAIAVWSRNLDVQGNSILGTHALEMLADRTGWSVFGDIGRHA